MIYRDEYEIFIEGLRAQPTPYILANAELAAEYLKEVRKDLPGVNMYTLGVNQFFIYTDKQKKALIDIVMRDIDSHNKRLMDCDRVLSEILENSGADESTAQDPEDDIKADVNRILIAEGLNTMHTTAADLDADNYLFMFDQVQDLLTAGMLPDCKRFEAAVTKHLQCDKKSYYNYMFMGFVAGVDMMNFIELTEAEQEGGENAK